MDQVFIQQLQVDAVIGAYDWEREIEQRLLLDVTMHCDISAAARGDDLAETLDYDAISQRIIVWIREARCLLIEAVADGLARWLLSQYPIAKVDVTVYKPGAVAAAQTVGVRVTREPD